MTEQEARGLVRGDAVEWSDGTPGRVVAFDYKDCIVIRFDGDGDNSYLHPADCQPVSRAKQEVAR